VLRALIEVLSFDLAAVEDEVPDIIAVIVAETLPVQSAPVVAVELLELLTHRVVKRI
jgi:flagellar motor switch protein FliG